MADAVKTKRAEVDETVLQGAVLRAIADDRSEDIVLGVSRAAGKNVPEADVAATLDALIAKGLVVREETTVTTVRYVLAKDE